MKEKLFLQSNELSLRLGSIQESDGEKLREWKNANRHAFFFQDIITPDQQAHWFEKYQSRADDYMFMVIVEAQTIGCMGFRMIERCADIYNLILGERAWGGKGLMSQAMRLMCSFILSDFSREIGAQVLRSNPAIRWYQQNGFRAYLTHDTFIEMRLDLTLFQPYAFHRTAMV